jgi:hypothetical protein
MRIAQKNLVVLRGQQLDQLHRGPLKGTTQSDVRAVADYGDGTPRSRGNGAGACKRVRDREVRDRRLSGAASGDRKMRTNRRRSDKKKARAER